MKRWTNALILGGLIIVIAAIADKGAFSDTFFQGISVTGFFFTLFKSLLVILIVSVSIPVAFIALLIDAILWFFTDFYFPLTDFLWNVVAEQIVLSWFWSNSTGNELFLAGLIVAVIGFVVRRSRRLSFG